jgi:hypothetical protein
MNELQMAAAKKAGIAVLAAMCFILLFRLSPILAIMLLFISGIGFGSYMFFMDMEMEKIREEEHKANMEKIRKETQEALDKFKR